MFFIIAGNVRPTAIDVIYNNVKSRSFVILHAMFISFELLEFVFFFIKFNFFLFYFLIRKQIGVIKN